MSKGCGSHEQWLDALAQVIEGRDAKCPCCGADDLRLSAVVTHPNGRATFSFWCDRCLWGLMPNAIAAERVARFIDADHAVTPPDYRIVQP
jgi:hypothetical protein